MIRRKSFIFVFASLLCFSAVFAQEAIHSVEDDYFDFLTLQGVVEKPYSGYKTLSDTLWTITDGRETDSRHVWSQNSLGTKTSLFSNNNAISSFFMDGISQNISLKIFGPHWYNSYNSDHPFGQNDGSLLQGVGYNTSFSVGARLEGYGFELTFKPVVTFSQNKDFDFLPGKTNPYSYYAGAIDLVQRYGDKPFYTFDWGDSEVRWTWNSFTMGFGTQSPWLGPAWLNPMLGSNNAAPYPKLDVGFRKTAVIIPGLDFYLGDFEARIWLGKLSQSEYFNGRKPDDRMINMGSFSFAPSFIKGLTFGMNRLFMTYWRKDNLAYFKRLFTFERKNALSSSGNDEDQKLSLYADWLFPEIGFEIYGEFGIDDFSLYELANPFHTGIYTIGVKQIINHTDNVYGLLNLEWNSFEMSQDFQLQWQYGGYYYHSFVNQGFTHKGQIIGAGSGTFGNSQAVSYTLYYNKGKTSINVQRNCPDINYILNKAVNTDAAGSDQWYSLYETFLSAGLSTTYFVTPNLCITAGGNLVFEMFHKHEKENEKLNMFYNMNLSLKYQL